MNTKNSSQSPGPNFSYEQAILDTGCRILCGTDEVGRGCLCGSVVAAAVILDPANIPEGLNDSKKLSKKKRELLFDLILSTSTVSIASVSAAEIDKINIRNASLEAMRRAIAGLAVQPEHVLVDGNVIPAGLPMPATSIIKGDGKSLSIAAASIVAKVTRDRMMEEACKTYPGYGFSKHAGYGTPEHLQAISKLGVTPLHRMTFAPLKNMQGFASI